MKWELKTYSDNSFTKYPYQHHTTLRRIFSWKNTWEIIKQHPVFGVGVGDYKDEMQAMYDKDGLDLSVNTHNQFLHIWAGTGIAGLLLFLFILFHWFRDIVLRKNNLLTRICRFRPAILYGGFNDRFSFGQPNRRHDFRHYFLFSRFVAFLSNSRCGACFAFR